MIWITTHALAFIAGGLFIAGSKPIYLRFVGWRTKIDDTVEEILD